MLEDEINKHEEEEEESEFDLSQFDNDYEEAEVEDREYDDLPDGRYQVNVDSVELTESKAGNPMLKWTFKIISATYTGRLLWKYSMISSADNVKWLKQDLVACGLELKRFSELPDRIGELLDVKLEVRVKKKYDFLNVYISRKIVLGVDGDADDCPF